MAKKWKRELLPILGCPTCCYDLEGEIEVIIDMLSKIQHLAGEHG